MSSRVAGLAITAILAMACGPTGSETVPRTDLVATAETLPVNFVSSSYGTAIVQVPRNEATQPTCELDVELPSGNLSRASGIKQPRVTTVGELLQYAWTYGRSESTRPGQGRHIVSCKWGQRRGRETASFVVR